VPSSMVGERAGIRIGVGIDMSRLSIWDRRGLPAPPFLAAALVSGQGLIRAPKSIK